MLTDILNNITEKENEIRLADVCLDIQLMAWKYTEHQKCTNVTTTNVLMYLLTKEKVLDINI